MRDGVGQFMHPGKKKNIGDMMVQETIPFSQERIKAVIISSSAGMKRLISQMDNTKNQLLSISMVASTGKQQGPAHEKKKPQSLLSFVG